MDNNYEPITLTPEQKIKVFEPMFKYFEIKEILEYFKEMVTRIPSAIFYKPASSSGKYHNSQQVGKYGQLVHIYMFFDILNMLLDLEHNRVIFTVPEERDLMRCVPALHDMYKYGKYGMRTYTTSEHPALAKEMIEKINSQKNFKHPLSRAWLLILCDMCESHSGEWNTWKVKEYDGEVRTGVMQKPRSTRDKLIHECDMLSSRNFLLYKIPDELKVIFETVIG